MELPDTLSRAQLAVNTTEMDDLESASMLSLVALSSQKYTELKECTKEELGFPQ